MKRQKPWQDGRKNMRCIRSAGVDPHAADRLFALTGGAFGLFEIGEDTGGPFIEGAALRRDLKLPGRTVEQARAQAAFQPCDQLAHCRRRHVRRRGRAGKTAEFDDPHEDLHLPCPVDLQSRHDDFISQVIIFSAFYFIEERASIFRRRLKRIAIFICQIMTGWTKRGDARAPPATISKQQRNAPWIIVISANPA